MHNGQINKIGRGGIQHQVMTIQQVRHNTEERVEKDINWQSAIQGMI